MPSQSSIRCLIWNHLERPGSEHFVLLRGSQHWILRGETVAALSPEQPMLVRYQVLCDDQWCTRRVDVERRLGHENSTFGLLVEDSTWFRNAQELPELRGILDVDLGITPSTNTLPIRRLQLRVGQSADVTAAWITFPNLRVQKLDQRYTRLDETHYLYSSANGFKAHLETDELGLVRHYPGGWDCVAQS